MDTLNIDLETYNPDLREEHPGTVLLYVGSVRITNNLKEFLTLPEDLGRKIVARVGPPYMDQERYIKGIYSNIEFVDYANEHEIATLMANADVIVNPPALITMLKANACGTPVAAYPSFHFAEYVVDHLNGVLDEDLAVAVVNAVNLDRNKTRRYTEDL